MAGIDIHLIPNEELEKMVVQYQKFTNQLVDEANHRRKKFIARQHILQFLPTPDMFVESGISSTAADGHAFEYEAYGIKISRTQATCEFKNGLPTYTYDVVITYENGSVIKFPGSQR